jgi:hypothetical protein
MSADNNICIMEWGNEWFVWHGSMSANYYEPASFEHGFATKEEARDFARQLYDEIGYVEGGIAYIGVDEQERALKEEIESLSLRLENLRKTGKQYEWMMETEEPFPSKKDEWSLTPKQADLDEQMNGDDDRPY